MPQIDSFITQQTPTNSRWTLSDGWIASGGEWCYLEFSNTRLANGKWVAAQNPNLSSSNGTTISTEIKSVSYENRGSETVVYVACKLSRIVDRSEVITVNISTCASTGSQFAAVLFPTVIRNYANCDSNGGASFALRAGGSPNTRKLDPATVSDGKLFMVRAEDATQSQIDVGIWDGGVSSLFTEQGGMVLKASNSAFNGEATVELSSNFLGAIPNYYPNPTTQNDILYIVVFRPTSTNGSGQFHLCHTQVVPDPGGGGGDGPSINPSTPDELDEDTFIRIAMAQSSTPLNLDTYINRDFWSVYHENLTSRTNFNVETAATDSFKLGNLQNRVCIAALRWNGTTSTFFTYNGHELGKFTTDSGDIANLPLGNPYTFFGVRNGLTAIDVAEIHCYETTSQDLFSDKIIAQFLAFLDEKYSTNAVQVYVDPSSGSDGNLGTQASPYASLSKALEKVAFGAGDQILFNAGTTQGILSSPLSVYPLGNTNAALGYSPDYPFVLGYYGTRSTGRVEHDFGYTVGKYLDIYGKNVNVAVNGHKFFSSQRNSVDPNYVGFASLANITSGDGYGVYYNWNPKLVYSPDSIQVIDCEISDSARHAISFRSYSSQINPEFSSQMKYSSVRRTQIHDLYNVYSTSSADHEPQENNFGVAGIYTEGFGGLHAEDNLFFRCGWSNNLRIAGISGATIGVSSATDEQLSSIATSFYESDLLRAEIVGINGIATSGSFLLVDYISGTTIAFREIPVAFNLSEGDVIDFFLTDGAPRNAACADIVINGISTGNNSIVHHKSWGPYGLVDNIHIEASGYNVLSDSSYFVHNSILESNFYGLAMSPGYTFVDTCFFGGSLAVTDEMRKSPTSNRSSHYTGRVKTGHYACKHTWQIYFTDSIGTVDTQIKNNIFHIPDATNIQGTDSFNSDTVYNRFYPSCYVWLDERDSGSVHAAFTKNTFYSLPGSMLIVAGSNPADDVYLDRNILQHETDFSPIDAGEIFYTFENPFTGNFGEISTLRVGDYNNYLVEGATEGSDIKSIKFETRTGLVDTIENPNAIDAYEWSFRTWKEETNDIGTYGTVGFITSARSIITYNGMSLGIPETQVAFATNAIGVHASGWSEAYSANLVNQHIRYSFTPINLSEETYANDYIGAVEFSSIGITFAPYFVRRGTFFGYGFN